MAASIASHPDDPTRRHRLIRQVTDRIHADQPDMPRHEIEHVVHQCRADLHIVHLDALPELLERLARQRLTDSQAP